MKKDINLDISSFLRTAMLMRLRFNVSLCTGEDIEITEVSLQENETNFYCFRKKDNNGLESSYILNIEDIVSINKILPLKLETPNERLLSFSVHGQDLAIINKSKSLARNQIDSYRLYE